MYPVFSQISTLKKAFSKYNLYIDDPKKELNKKKRFIVKRL